MKKFLMIFLALFLMIGLSSAFSQVTSIVVDNGTITWEAPLDAKGSVIPAIELTYEVYLSDYPISNPQDPTAHMLLGTVSTNEFVWTLSDTKKHTIGVRAIRTESGDVAYGDIAWSYVSEDADPAIGPWTVRDLPRPDKAKNLRNY